MAELRTPVAHYMCPRPCTVAAILIHARHTDHPLHLQVGCFEIRWGVAAGCHRPQSLVAIVLHVPMIAAILYMND